MVLLHQDQVEIFHKEWCQETYVQEPWTRPSPNTILYPGKRKCHPTAHLLVLGWTPEGWKEVGPGRTFALILQSFFFSLYQTRLMKQFLPKKPFSSSSHRHGFLKIRFTGKAELYHIGSYSLALTKGKWTMHSTDKWKRMVYIPVPPSPVPCLTVGMVYRLIERAWLLVVSPSKVWITFYSFLSKL
jgi:hypothetical protein